MIVVTTKTAISPKTGKQKKGTLEMGKICGKSRVVGSVDAPLK